MKHKPEWFDGIDPSILKDALKWIYRDYFGGRLFIHPKNESYGWMLIENQ